MSVIQVTADTFNAEVLKSPIPVLADFYADFCSPCKSLAPILEQLAAEVKGRAKVVKVDVATEETLAREYGIDVIPTLIVFHNGQAINRMVGTQTNQELRAALNL